PLPRGSTGRSDLAQARWVDRLPRHRRLRDARVTRRIEGLRRGLRRTADNSRIDLFDERDAEAVVLLPGHRSFDPAKVAQIDADQRSARHAHVAFGHHAAGREVADLDAVRLILPRHLELGEQEQAVAVHLTGVDVAHGPGACGFPSLARWR